MYLDMNNDCMNPVVPESYYMDPGNAYSDPMPIYDEPIMPHPHMYCPCRCPLMMDPNFRRCMQICMRQHECGNYMYGEIPMELEYPNETEEEEKE